MKEKHPDHTISLQDRLIQFCTLYWRQILYPTALSLVLLISAFFLFFKPSAPQLNYLKAEKNFNQFILDPNPENAAEVQTIITNNAPLLQKYQGAFAQRLMIKDQWEASYPYAAGSLKMNEGIQISPFEQFSIATLAIGKNRLADALKVSENLKDELTANPALLSQLKLLQAYNLLRIAFLQKELNALHNEKKAWSEYKEFTKTQNVTNAGINDNSNYLLNFEKSFRFGDISLNDFIRHRENILSEQL